MSFHQPHCLSRDDASPFSVQRRPNWASMTPLLLPCLAFSVRAPRFLLNFICPLWCVFFDYPCWVTLHPDPSSILNGKRQTHPRQTPPCPHITIKELFFFFRMGRIICCFRCSVHTKSYLPVNIVIDHIWYDSKKHPYLLNPLSRTMILSPLQIEITWKRHHLVILLR